MPITGTHFNYFHLCHRKLWLFANGITMEHTSDAVYEGKLIHESAYPQRPERYQEVEVAGIKIDFYDQKNKVIHEIKKSDKIEDAHEWQVKFYIYTLENIGVEGVTGILEYPQLRKTSHVSLNDEDRRRLMEDTIKIEELIESEKCPPIIKSKICKSCSYYEFCYCKEEE
jgi:CRISPR-associated exonuclease Cas4